MEYIVLHYIYFLSLPFVVGGVTGGDVDEAVIKHIACNYKSAFQVWRKTP